jgi:hypothetical protein
LPAGGELRSVNHFVREQAGLELALLRRGVDEISAGCERCKRCHRTPLVGERVYVYEADKLLCELCRALEGKLPLSSHLIHGPEFGHTMRIIDQRPAAA